MRINYYRFPDDFYDEHIKYENGADLIKGECLKGYANCRNCPFNKGLGFHDCKFFRALKADDTISGITLTNAKKLLKKFGGFAWTEHIDRNGGCFETTDIKLNKNNSNHKYNRHL